MQSQALIDRMVGVAKLDVGTYEEIERDTNATVQAALVVVIASLAGGIGSLREDGISGLIGGTIAGLIGWAVFSVFVYFVGTRLLATQATEADAPQVMRVLGFAYAPQILTVFGLIPILGAIVSLIASIWFLVTSVVAIRQSLEMSTGRAIATGLIAIIVQAIVMAIIAAIFGIALWGLG